MSGRLPGGVCEVSEVSAEREPAEVVSGDAGAVRCGEALRRAARAAAPLGAEHRLEEGRRLRVLAVEQAREGALELPLGL